jgi:hypothetical protein
MSTSDSRGADSKGGENPPLGSPAEEREETANGEDQHLSELHG